MISIQRRRFGVALIVGLAVFGTAFVGQASAAPKSSNEHGKSAVAHAKNAERKGEVASQPSAPIGETPKAKSTVTPKAATATPAPNGDGDGKAVGKPAAGSVGNADSKSPKGQTRTDKNKGYECDDNKGVGKGNPAHTGCTTVVSSSSLKPTPAPTTTTTAAPAPAEVLGAQVTKPVAPTAAAETAVGSAALAKTGANYTTPVILGILLSLIGIGAVVALHNQRIKRLMGLEISGNHLATPYGPLAPEATGVSISD